MTVQQVAIELLRMIGVVSLDPTVDSNSTNSRGITPGDLQALIVCINAAMQECLDEGPSALSSELSGGILYPPTPVTLAVTQYSSTIAAQPTGWASWMNECTIRMAGDPYDNRIRYDSIANAYSLQGPALCATGSVAATVYCDALLIPFKNIVDPVKIGERHLTVVGGMDRLGRGDGNGRRGPVGNEVWQGWWEGSYLGNSRPVGFPQECFADTTFNPAASSVPVYLRVWPMPAIAYRLEYTGKQGGPTFSTTDIDNGDHVTDPMRAIPEQWDESIFLPVAKNIFRNSGLCTLSDQQSAALDGQYAKAIKKLQGWRPMIGSVEAVYL